MRAVLHALLLIGVLIGLATQGAALAAEPCPMEHAQSSEMGAMDCCPEDGSSSHSGAPCSDMTLACLVTTGCATLSVLQPNEPGDLAAHRPGGAQFWQSAAILRGRTIPPDTHPPARLV